MQDRDYYSIEDHDGVRMIHYLGWYYPHDSYDRWVSIELSGAFMPLDKFVEFARRDRLDVLSDMAEVSTQYYHYLSEEEGEEEQAVYFNGSPGIRLPFREVTIDTPCGDYWAEG